MQEETHSVGDCNRDQESTGKVVLSCIVLVLTSVVYKGPPEPPLGETPVQPPAEHECVRISCCIC